MDSFASSLPLEMQLAVLSFLTPWELCNIALVSKYWSWLSEDNFLWARFVGNEPTYGIHSSNKQRYKNKIQRDTLAAEIGSELAAEVEQMLKEAESTIPEWEISKCDRSYDSKFRFFQDPDSQKSDNDENLSCSKDLPMIIHSKN